MERALGAAQTQKPIVEKLNAAVNDAMKSPEVQEQYRKQLLQLGGGTPQHMAQVMKEDTARWSEVIREADRFRRSSPGPNPARRPCRR